MASGGSIDKASAGLREPKKYGRKFAELKWDIYDDHTQKAKPGWESVPHPWSANIAMQYVCFLHFDRLWPKPCHEIHCRATSTNYNRLQDVKTKWRFLTSLRNISNLERWRKGQIPKSVACMMYAEHVLRVRVD